MSQKAHFRRGRQPLRAGQDLQRHLIAVNSNYLGKRAFGAGIAHQGQIAQSGGRLPLRQRARRLNPEDITRNFNNF